MIIGWDCDGPLHGFGNGVRAYLDSIGRSYGWKDGHTENHIWDFNEYWHMPREEFAQVCHDAADAGMLFQGQVRPGAVEATKRSRALGHTNILITDRFFGATPEVSHELTRRFIAENDFAIDDILFSADKTIIKTDMFVEDKLSNYDALVENGTNAFLINYAWNEVEGGDTRNRIDSITEYADAIELATEKGYVDLTIA